MPTGGRPCTVCRHQDREAIDRALVAGDGFAEVSRRFAVSQDAITRHVAKHVPTAAMQAAAHAVAEAEGVRGSTLAYDAAELRTKALGILHKAEAAGDLRVALMGVREAARCVELMAKLAGEIDTTTQVNILVAPMFVTVQAMIIAALEPYPDARRAVVAALEGVR